MTTDDEESAAPEDNMKRPRIQGPPPNPVNYVRVRFFKDRHDWHSFLDGKLPHEPDGSVDLLTIAAGLRLPGHLRIRVSWYSTDVKHC